jgi:hypothetical protein
MQGDSMKLSEVLKEDWPEKREVCEVNSNPAFTFDNNVHFYNEALTSCDREIDREALAKVIAGYFESQNRKHSKAVQEGDWGANWAWSTEVSDVIIDLSKDIISTMPTWLKRIE